jgi:hypothetical protein
VTANGRILDSNDPTLEDIQPESKHSSSTRGAIAQVSLNTAEILCEPLMLVNIFL